MPRKTRSLDRDEGVLRDASLVVIASEDSHAVQQYFSRFRPKRVQFKVLPTEEGNSSPEKVLQRLDKFKAEEATEDGDQFWICIDTDHWIENNHIQNLMSVLKQCRQKGYRVALCNPCFEIWIYLHFAEWETKQNTPPKCKEIEFELKQLCNGYNKSNLKRVQIDKESVLVAVERAKLLDTNPDEILPAHVVTRVHLLLELLLSRESIVLD